MIKVDASIVINLDTIIDKPLTPPNTNSFGNRNKLKAIAINKIPITNSKYLLICLLLLLFLKYDLVFQIF